MSRALTNEAVFRLEVSLSSRKSSAIVMRTQARLYTLDKGPAVETPTPNTQWKSLAYGAPCIQLMRDTTEHNSPFHIKVVIAEVESGISLWEAEVTDTSGYNAMQTNFHTFSSNGKTFAIQFANAEEAQRMLESIHDLFLQKQKAETVAFDSKPDQPIFKKPKSFRRLGKKDISAPCNFKHVSGITVQRTQMCEDELRGTIQRKMRSMSLSSLVNRGGKGQEEGGSSPGRRKSLRNKFGSLRSSKMKGVEDPGTGMSLPSHGHKTSRPPITNTTFQSDRKSPSRSLSLSSSDLVSLRRPSGSTLERRHTLYNYVPYSKSGARVSSDVPLNKTVPMPSGPVPPPTQLTSHYQVPTQSRAGYAVPVSSHYRVPPRPYAVVGVGSQPNLTSHNGTQVYDMPKTQLSTQRNKYHNINLRQARSMSPLKEPPEEMSPSHSGVKVAPLTAATRQEAFQEGPTDSLASHSSSSMQDNYTDAMAKALEQFDSLLQPPHGNKQIIQTSL